MHTVVALIEDLPEEGLVRGQVGTVVENWAPDVYEVEFSDGDGRTYAMAALKAEQLMRLHHEPVHQAAWRLERRDAACSRSRLALLLRHCGRLRFRH
jgi:hypothetical protein